MKQLTQKLKSGEIKVQDVPSPIVGKGMVLVRNHYSVISPGTEASTAKSARKSLFAKAKERPEQVKQVFQVIKQQGPIQAYRAVTKKLEAYSPCGYSSAGIVIDVGEGVDGFTIGDRVACAGVGFANHAEVISVPINLCVKLKNDANLEHAAYNTLGAIAMQGVRQADLRLGETCAVIGLGLLGQLTCQMLRASGVKTVGIDVKANVVEVAAEHSADMAFTRDNPGITQTILDMTGGAGADAVIITASTDSLDPVNFAGDLSRKKGSVIIVGAVPTGFSRDKYYKKELELKMSCSYGPGRYDLNYEEKGIDYPSAYVRWTEKRNMESFQELIYNKQINLEPLTTHHFKFASATDAYELIVGRNEDPLGVILEYDIDKEIRAEKIELGIKKTASDINIAFIGAGSYAQGNLLPNLPKKDKSVTFSTILSNTGTTSKRVAERFGFSTCTSDEKDIFENSEINTVFIATRHDSHAEYVVKTLEKHKNVFVEKPLTINRNDLFRIRDAYRESGAKLLVGYNRRFSPLAKKLKKKIGTNPMSMIYRVNAGYIPKDTWIQDMEIGGGRILGEACHFIDFMTFMCDSVPVRVYASSMPTPENFNDITAINIEFANGSIGTVNYYANGSKAMGKELFEVYSSGNIGIIQDYKTMQFVSGKIAKEKLHMPDKGQKNMVGEFLKSLTEESAELIPFEQIIAVTLASFAVLESIETKMPVDVKLSGNADILRKKMQSKT